MKRTTFHLTFQQANVIADLLSAKARETRETADRYEASELKTLRDIAPRVHRYASDLRALGNDLRRRTPSPGAKLI